MTEESNDSNFNKLLTQLFQEETNWEKRAEAARQLGFLRDNRATNLLCKALKNEKDTIVVNRIIEAMGRIADPKATKSIIEKLNDEFDKFEGDKYRIVYILEALTQIKDKRALSYISSLLNSPDTQLRDLTIKAFETIEPNWREIVQREQKKNEKTLEEIFYHRL